ncbi:glycosyltransferase [Paludibacterium paludis]|uniref:Glycosyltransferase involved in cell wall biosynthesis n=1 Tax=Paludibacterium paludis TaxID=1225769 RepID=A0A918UBJ3_9NEIS|nr:glycosyltransferase [Paludibacterium paludis]GGY24598.1 hypothetical protein GCM10011289_30270 [Paludibacterium paludis]
MRVLRLTPFFHHPDADAWPAEYDSVGGMQIQAWRQAMWLAQQGVSQHVMTIGFPGLPRLRDLHGNLRVERAYLPLPRFRSELTGLWGLTQSWALATLLSVRRRARREPFDLVHAHLDGQIPALLVACLAPFLLRRPMALTIHCSRLSVYRPMSAWDRATHGLACRLERKALAAAAVSIALTERTARVIGPHARRVEVVPDVVDPRQFQAPCEGDIEAFRRRYRLDGPVVGFVGRIAKEKGWPHFVELAARLRDPSLRFLVVGDGPQRERLEQAVANAGLQDRFTVTGFIPNDKVPAALAACRVVVMPSEHEEFGGVAIEAMAVGTPVVGYAVGGIKEILGRLAPDRLAPPGDVERLGERVRAVLDEPSAGVRCAAEPSPIHAFAPDTVLPRLAALYRELAGLSAPKAPSTHSAGMI